MPSRICASRSETKCGSLVREFVCSNAVLETPFFFELPMCIPSLSNHLNLQVCLDSAIFVGFVCDFQFFRISQLRMMHARTWFKISSRSVVPKKCRHLHLDRFCTLVCWLFQCRYRVLAAMRSVFSVLWVWRERRPSLWELWKLEI